MVQLGRYFFFSKMPKNLGRSDDGKRKKEDGLTSKESKEGKK